MFKWICSIRPGFHLPLPWFRARSAQVETKRCRIQQWRLLRLIEPLPRRAVGVAFMVVAISSPGPAVAQGYTPDKQEIMLMSPLCQWMRGSRAGMDPALIPKAPPMDVSGCSRFHYYCWAELELVRAEKSVYSNPGQSKYHFDKALSMLKGQVQYHGSTPGCSKFLRADVSYTLGKTLERYARFTKSKSYYGEAIGPLLQSIELNPDDARPYEVLGDVYAALGKRQQAEEAIYGGLEINPESKPLLRKYKEIGGKRPIPAKKIPASVEAERAEGAASLEATGKPVESQEAVIPAISEAPAGGSAVVEAPAKSVGAQSGPDNSTPPRYCRFCPDADNSQNQASPPPSPPESTGATTDAQKQPCRFCP